MISLLISLLIGAAVAFFGFSASRRFVREKLRYVEAAHRSSAPFIAGGGALLVGALIAMLVPFVGAGTALTFALAIGTGVAVGSRDVRTGRHLLGDGTR